MVFVVFHKTHIKHEEGKQGSIKLLDEIMVEHKRNGPYWLVIGNVVEWFKNMLTYHRVQLSIGWLWVLCQHLTTLWPQRHSIVLEKENAKAKDFLLYL